MKRLALLTVFFYVCTFAAPPRAQAVAPVALIGAAAVGTALMSASIGTYYAQNGVMPAYVSATAGAVASAADAVFQPSYLAKGVYHLFTPESLTTAKDYYIGKASALGVTLGDLIDFVSNSADSLYTDLKSLFASNVLPSTGYPSGSLSSGTVICDSSGALWMITSVASLNLNAASYSSYVNSSRPTIIYDGHTGWLDGLSFYVFYPELGVISYKYYQGVRIVVAPTTLPTTLDPSSGGYNYPGIKDALDQANMDASVANDVRDAIAALPESKVIPAPSVPATTADPGAAPSITAAELSAALQANTLAVANAVAEQAAAIAAANPEDAAAQIAAAQAAAEAAKAAAAAEEAANESEPEPEPSYPVPSTWYTKTCDLSNGLGSCIDYQQVINATSAFQSTALYQFPNIILQCLGYVEGDGCEYPPKISVDLFTRFSTGPINVDLSPFESVVKVMKFFFAILCLVGTGKATMTLFE